MKKIFFILLFTSLLTAGTTGKLTGLVTDAESGQPLPGCNVLIAGTDLGAATGPDGRYFILNIPPGVYTVKASMIGYATQVVQEVRISVDLTTTINFQLSVEVLMGKEITVVAERAAVRMDLTSSEARVTSEQLDVLPVTEIWDVISVQAGITKDAGGGIHIRGGRSQEIAYWVDGVSVTDGYDGGIAIAVDNNAIQELQVISGTFNAEYGQAMSGIINLVTKDGGQRYEGFLSAYSAGYVTDSYYPHPPDSVFTLKAAAREEPVDFTNELNWEGSLSGPVPGLGKFVTFYGYFRRNQNNGWLDGWRIFNAYGDTLVTVDSSNGEITYSAPERVHMNWRSRWNTNLKLTFHLGPKLKLRLGQITSRESYQSYNHYAQFSPDGERKQFSSGENLKINLTHTLSPRTFYTVDLSRFRKEYHHYAFPDADDPRYIDPHYYRHVETALPAASLKIWGVELSRFKRQTTTWIGKFDLTSQITRLHQIKFGVEYRRHELFLDGYAITDADESDTVFTIRVPGYYAVEFNDTLPPWDGTAPGSWVLRDTTTGSLIGWDWKSSREPVRTGFQTRSEAREFNDYFNKYVQFGRGRYDETPEEFAAYIQDKLEFKNLILNLGLRFDWFSANSVVPANPAEPFIGNPRREELDSLTLYQREHIDWSAYIDPNGDGHFDDSRYAGFLPDSGKSLVGKKGWWTATTPKYQLSPRLGISYPITDKGYIHFSFGHFFQVPSYERLYTNPGYKMSEDIGKYGIYGNPDLRPQKTVMYELGLKQEIFRGLTIDVTGYYRDVRDWVSSGIPITVSDGVSYFTYVNRDYSNVRGVTINLDRRFSGFYGFNLNYTFQVAEGSNSNPEEEFAAVLQNQEPTRAILPLDWDQTHTLNGALYLGRERWNLSFIGQFGSGYPYTPTISTSAMQNINIGVVNLRNSRRKPITYNLDMNFQYQLPVTRVRAQLFVKIYNLLDRRNENIVYGDTGRANRTLSINNVYEPERPNTIAEFYNHREWYSAPRKVQLGINLNF
jgi:outer membrane receptor protein involved in Fe transport